MREGEESDRMYFLSSGKVEISRGGRAVCTMGRLGNVIGETGVIYGELRSATVTATTAVQCFATKSVFDVPLSERENILFLHLMEKAVTRVLMGRLKNTSKTSQKVTRNSKKANEKSNNLPVKTPSSKNTSKRSKNKPPKDTEAQDKTQKTQENSASTPLPRRSAVGGVKNFLVPGNANLPIGTKYHTTKCSAHHTTTGCTLLPLVARASCP